MNKLLLLILTTLILEGCQVFGEHTAQPEPVVINTEPVERNILQPPMPSPAEFESVRFIVITEDNLDQQIEEIKQLTGDNWVVYAMTPHDYENLSYNMQEITRIIRHQRDIILYYRDVTQNPQNPTAPETSTDQPVQETKRTLFQRLLGKK